MLLACDNLKSSRYVSYRDVNNSFIMSFVLLEGKETTLSDLEKCVILYCSDICTMLIPIFNCLFCLYSLFLSINTLKCGIILSQ